MQKREQSLSRGKNSNLVIRSRPSNTTTSESATFSSHQFAFSKNSIRIFKPNNLVRCLRSSANPRYSNIYEQQKRGRFSINIFPRNLPRFRCVLSSPLIHRLGGKRRMLDETKRESANRVDNAARYELRALGRGHLNYSRHLMRSLHNQKPRTTRQLRRGRVPGTRNCFELTIL